MNNGDNYKNRIQQAIRWEGGRRVGQPKCHVSFFCPFLSKISPKKSLKSYVFCKIINQFFNLVTFWYIFLVSFSWLNGGILCCLTGLKIYTRWSSFWLENRYLLLALNRASFIKSKYQLQRDICPCWYLLKTSDKRVLTNIRVINKPSSVLNIYHNLIMVTKTLQ